ncbi:hypothetical protein BRYFOR_07871 [Marvinbryantia formatexigens DSM 14469]|uniref:Uncharacterized protein n=1 Tax=Marvinbryantia formatexigens DSM 14469 TaxID=478749 RepID=C6LGW1_9FIRM|nr:hypothetical protein BRYFOR_07871 [Marvinbryantia formatexigens DSM 14469]
MRRSFFYVTLELSGNYLTVRCSAAFAGCVCRHSRLAYCPRE